MIGWWESLECRIVECGVFLSNGFFTRNFLLEIDDLLNFRQRYNNTGIFMSAYSYSESNQKEALLLGDLYFDFDQDELDEEAFNKMKQDVSNCVYCLKTNYSIPEEAIDLFFSGNKGIHLIVKKEWIGIEPHFNLNQIFRNIAEEINGSSLHKMMDLKVYDRRRLWRIPNSKHNKSGLYKIPITLDEFRTLCLEGIRELAQNPRVLLNKPEPSLISQANFRWKKKMDQVPEKPKPKAPRNYNNNVELKVVPPCIDEIINGKVVKGQRNNTAMVLASFFFQSGIQKADCYGRIDEWNTKRCEEPLPQSEIDMVIEHVYSEGYSFGCQGARTLSTCNIRKCPFRK
jgi:hypothetical protein